MFDESSPALLLSENHSPSDLSNSLDTMLSLADELELMNDFEDDVGSDEEMNVEEEVEGETISDELLTGGIKQAEALDPDAVAQMELGNISEVGKVAKLYTGKLLKEVLTVSFQTRTHVSTVTEHLRVDRKSPTINYILILTWRVTVIALSTS